MFLFQLFIYDNNISMSVLILINTEKLKIKNIDDCITRDEVFAFLLYKYLKGKGMKVTIRKCYPNVAMRRDVIRNLSVNNFNFVNHIVFVNETGFAKVDSYFLVHLRKFAKNVYSLCSNSKFYRGEDLLFTFFVTLSGDNIVGMKPGCDPYLYDVGKLSDALYFLFVKPDDGNNDIYLNYFNGMLEKLNAWAKRNVEYGLVLLIGELDRGKGIRYIDTEGNTIGEQIFDSYGDYIAELVKCNVCFVYYRCIDFYFFYELGMCDVTIVSRTEFVGPDLIERLGIVVVDGLRPVFDMMLSNSVRDTLIIEGYTWNACGAIVYRKIIGMDIDNDERQQPIHKPENRLLYTLNLENKKQAKITNIQNTIINKPHRDQNQNTYASMKRSVLLQSNILRRI